MNEFKGPVESRFVHAYKDGGTQNCYKIHESPKTESLQKYADHWLIAVWHRRTPGQHLELLSTNVDWYDVSTGHPACRTQLAQCCSAESPCVLVLSSVSDQESLPRKLKFPHDWPAPHFVRNPNDVAMVVNEESEFHRRIARVVRVIEPTSVSADLGGGAAAEDAHGRDPDPFTDPPNVRQYELILQSEWLPALERCPKSEIQRIEIVQRPDKCKPYGPTVIVNAEHVMPAPNPTFLHAMASARYYGASDDGKDKHGFMTNKELPLTYHIEHVDISDYAWCGDDFLPEPTDRELADMMKDLNSNSDPTYPAYLTLPRIQGKKIERDDKWTPVTYQISPQLNFYLHYHISAYSLKSDPGKHIKITSLSELRVACYTKSGKPEDQRCATFTVVLQTYQISLLAGTSPWAVTRDRPWLADYDSQQKGGLWETRGIDFTLQSNVDVSLEDLFHMKGISDLVFVPSNVDKTVLELLQDPHSPHAGIGFWTNAICKMAYQRLVHLRGGRIDCRW